MCEEDFTMKKYRVNVNGTVYEVELEEITGAVPSASMVRAEEPLTGASAVETETKGSAADRRSSPV